MDFNDTPEEAAYRAEVARLAGGQAEPKARASDVQMPLRTGRRPATKASTSARAWQAKKAEAGYACITWPKEWGGGGGAPMAGGDLRPGRGASSTSPRNPFAIGLGMCVPTVMAFGNEADKERFVGPALRGEEIWCQLFSEPAGGSDVAAARTRAVAGRRRLDDQRPEGLDHGRPLLRLRHRCVTRTDPDVPKHKGLTMFWIDMKRRASRCGRSTRCPAPRASTRSTSPTCG